MPSGMGRVEIARRIRTRIARGEWAPGEKVPSTREFAEQFDVSPKTAAEALAIIVGEGLLLAVPGVGRFIPRNVSYPTEPP